MHNIVNITYPRSGHHYLVGGCLRKILGPKLRYCEQYNHCREFPCPDQKVNYQKSHDFFFTDHILPDRKYIIQYRHPYESIVSNYKLELKLEHIEKDSRRNWERFLEESLYNWISFMTKWVVMTKVRANITEEDILYIEYYDLIHNTESTLSKVLDFIGEPQVDFMQKIVKPELKNRVQDFRYYSRKDLRRVNGLAGSLIKTAGVRRTT